VKAGADVNARDARQSTPLHAAVLRGNVEVVRALGPAADPDKQDEEGRSPLHLAAQRGNIELITLLLKHGAHINVRDNRGYTPVQEAETSGNEAAARLMRAFPGSP
jgi:ankyrin repeat protein